MTPVAANGDDTHVKVGIGVGMGAVYQYSRCQSKQTKSVDWGGGLECRGQFRTNLRGWCAADA